MNKEFSNMKGKYLHNFLEKFDNIEKFIKLNL